jgi:hypothetical protein
MKFMFAILPFIFSATAFAMPHDQPELDFYSNKTTSVGLVYGQGTTYGVDISDHRALQQVYVCQNGKMIANYTHFKAIIDANGAFIVGKDKSGATFRVERQSDGVDIIQSTLPKLKVDSTEALTLKLTQSGIQGFELDWSNPCAPKEQN